MITVEVNRGSGLEDWSAYVDPFPDLRVENVATGGTGTASVTFTDPPEAPRNDWGLRITDDAVELFEGLIRGVRGRDETHPGGPQVYEVTGVDFNALLDDDVVPRVWRSAAETDKQRITWLVETYGTHGIVAGTHVAEIIGPMPGGEDGRPEQQFGPSTLRKALEKVTRLSGGQIYVDFDKELHHFAGDEAIAAPFGLSDTPNDTTTFAFFDFTLEDDDTPRVDEVVVFGAQQDTGGLLTVTRTVPTPPPPERRRRAPLVDDTLTSVEAAEAAGDAFLAANAGRRSGRLRTLAPGLRAGMTVQITHTGRGLVAEPFRIHTVVTVPDTDRTAVYEVAFGDEPPSLAALVGGTSGALATARDAVAASSLVASRIADLTAAGANQVVNSSFENAVGAEWSVGANWAAGHVPTGGQTAFAGTKVARAALSAQTAGALVTAAIPVDRRDDWWISAWSFVRSRSSGSARIEVREYDAGSTLLATTVLAELGAADDDWTRRSIRFGPNDQLGRRAFHADTVAIRVAFLTPGSATLTWDVDAVQVERGGLLTAYAPRPQELVDGQITTAQMANLAITLDKLADGAVSTAKIVDGAVEGVKVAINAITDTKIATDAVTSPKIIAGAVTTGKLDALAVTADKIAANAVTTEKLDALAVTADKIAANAVTAVKIAANAVEADKIAANAVVAGKIAANAVTTDKLDAGAVTTDKLAAGQITLYDDNGEVALAPAGFGPTWQRFLLSGFFNGDFSAPPPTLSSELHNTTNPLPHWSYTRVSGTRAWARVVADSAQGSGYRLEFVLEASGAAGDEAYIEQIIPINASRSQVYGVHPWAAVQATSAISGERMTIAAQFLKRDGSTTGSAFATDFAVDSSAGITELGFPLGSWTGIPPTDAAFLRIRFGMKRGAAANSKTNVFRVFEAYRTIAPPRLEIADISGSVRPAIFRMDSSSLFTGSEGLLCYVEDLDIRLMARRLIVDPTSFERHGGTSFPASPSHGDLFFRSDLGDWYLRIGSVWYPARLHVGAKVARTTSQSISASTTFNAIAFNASDVWDQPPPGAAEFHNPSSNNTRLVLPLTGKYRLHAKVEWAANTSTGIAMRRILQMRYNGGGGTNADQRTFITGAANVDCHHEGTWEFAGTAGHYVEVYAAQSTTGTLNINAAEATIEYLG